MPKRSRKSDVAYKKGEELFAELQAKRKAKAAAQAEEEEAPKPRKTVKASRKYAKKTTTTPTKKPVKAPEEEIIEESSPSPQQRQAKKRKTHHVRSPPRPQRTTAPTPPRKSSTKHTPSALNSPMPRRSTGRKSAPQPSRSSASRATTTGRKSAAPKVSQPVYHQPEQPPEESEDDEFDEQGQVVEEEEDIHEDETIAAETHYQETTPVDASGSSSWRTLFWVLAVVGALVAVVVIVPPPTNVVAPTTTTKTTCLANSDGTADCSDPRPCPEFGLCINGTLITCTSDSYDQQADDCVMSPTAQRQVHMIRELLLKYTTAKFCGDAPNNPYFVTDTDDGRPLYSYSGIVDILQLAQNPDILQDFDYRPDENLIGLSVTETIPYSLWCTVKLGVLTLIGALLFGLWQLLLVVVTAYWTQLASEPLIVLLVTLGVLFWVAVYLKIRQQARKRREKQQLIDKMRQCAFYELSHHYRGQSTDHLNLCSHIVTLEFPHQAAMRTYVTRSVWPQIVKMAQADARVRVHGERWEWTDAVPYTKDS